MVIQLSKTKLRHILTSFVVLISVWASSVSANPLGQIPQIPQIPAFLPLSVDVPMTKKLAIDGEWMISTIKKRIRIEGGRAYAIDSWLHLFVLKIQPLMVVSKDWRRTGPGEYTGQDLPLMGAFTAKLGRDGNLSVSVAGALGPVTFSLIPIRMDNQRRFERAKAGKADRRPPPRQKEYYEEDSDYYQDEEYSEESDYEEEYSEEDYEYEEGEDYYEDDEEYYEEQ